MNRLGLDRFKKAQSTEPFRVESSTVDSFHPSIPASSNPFTSALLSASTSVPSHNVPNSSIYTPGQGHSTWKTPDWAIEPKAGIFSLDVIKGNVTLGSVLLDRKRVIFGRQIATCDLVLDHPSISRQHAVLLHHKNGRVFVIDLGSVHGTFISGERLKKNIPCELEIGQSMKFAASSRTYVLRKKVDVISHMKQNILPPPPDPNDTEAVLAYNTILNRFGISPPETPNSKYLEERAQAGGKRVFSPAMNANDSNGENEIEMKQKWKKKRVSFRDYSGGSLADVVDIYHDSNVVNALGKFDSLVKSTIIPRDNFISKENQEDKGLGLTTQFREYLQQMKNQTKGEGLYQGLENVEVGLADGLWAMPSAISIENNEADKEMLSSHDGNGK